MARSPRPAWGKRPMPGNRRHHPVRGILAASLAALALVAPVAAQGTGPCEVHGAIDNLLNLDAVSRDGAADVRGWAIDARAPAGTGISGVRLSLDRPLDQASARVQSLPYGFE